MKPSLPKVIISACLVGQRTRYDGRIVDDGIARALSDRVNLVTVCPETAIGLPVPRPKIRLVTTTNGIRVLHSVTDADLTDSLTMYAREFLAQHRDAAGFVLKAKSPSCGMGDCRLYPNAAAEESTGFDTGVFAQQARQLFPEALFVNENDLEAPGSIDRFFADVSGQANSR